MTRQNIRQTELNAAGVILAFGILSLAGSGATESATTAQAPNLSCDRDSACPPITPECPHSSAGAMCPCDS